MQRVILVAVFEFLPHAAADLEMMIRCDGHVAAVEQRVQVGAQEYAVVGFVGPLFGVGPDVEDLYNENVPVFALSIASAIRCGYTVFATKYWKFERFRGSRCRPPSLRIQS